MKVKYQKGLTLTEVLIVVALLLLLMLAIFKVFNIDISRTKDAERKSDLLDIKLAFEDYYNDHQTYPPVEFLDDCNGDSFQPYLKSVPCDPVTGEPYVYIPFPGDGDNSKGYRVLSILEDKSDPIIEKLGCQNGCGIPAGNANAGENSHYVYGIAEGVPLVLDNILPSDTPTPTPIITSAPTAVPSYCDTHLCFCCANSALNSQQDCNIWVQGNNCDMGPFKTVAQCYSDTPCRPQ